MKKKIISILLSSAMIFSMGISTVSAAAADDTASTESIVVSKTEGITDTTYGKVRGFIDDGTYTFRGIPYAKADRFEMPEAPDSWDGIRNCLVYGSTAPITKMTDPDGGDFIIPHRYWAQSEDCQNLNVWTQDLDTNAKKPVMVWFHGGGFTNGSSIEGVAYDGKNLSEYGDVVVVTVNHRLNVLGYMDLSDYGEDYKYSGNCGTADIVASLKWVKENIANFGGDPDNVTIFGQSGGGCKVLNMFATSEAEGLFDQAIVQSGGEGHIDQDTAKKVAAKTLEILGISADQIDQIKDVPYDTLDAAATEAQKQVGEELGTYVGWSPVLDEDYLHTDYLDWTNDVPVMVGSVFGEMNCWTALDPNETNKNSWTDEEVDAKLTEKYGDKAEAVKEAFLKAYPEKSACDAYYVSDRTGDFGTLAKRLESGDNENYNYLVSYESPLDGGVNLWHCGEIPFVFHNVDLVAGSYGGSQDAYDLQDVMASAWVNFASTGDPNGENVPEWSTYTDDNKSTMVFDTTSGERIGYDAELQELISQ